MPSGRYRSSRQIDSLKDLNANQSDSQYTSNSYLNSIYSIIKLFHDSELRLGHDMKSQLQLGSVFMACFELAQLNAAAKENICIKRVTTLLSLLALQSSPLCFVVCNTSLTRG